MMPFNPQRLCVVSLLLGASLTGCAGSGDISTASYLLPATSAKQQQSGRLSVMVAPITMAAFLKGDGIVMQLDDIEVHQARNHLWAEALPGQLRQLLMDRLSASLPQAQIVSRGQPHITGAPVRELRLQLDRFQGRYDGQALIRGHWQILNEQGELLSQRAFQVATPLEEDGYPALVRALATGWEQVADSLAIELGASLKS